MRHRGGHGVPVLGDTYDRFGLALVVSTCPTCAEIKGYDAQGRPYKNKRLSVSEVRSEKPQANGQGVTEIGYGNLPA